MTKLLTLVVSAVKLVIADALAEEFVGATDEVFVVLSAVTLLLGQDLTRLAFTVMTVLLTLVLAAV